MADFAPITPEEARGNSRAVSASRFNRLASQGKRFLDKASQNTSTAGLDRDWEGIKDKAYAASREPWGGATINSHTGEFTGDTGSEVEAKTNSRKGFGIGHYAITVKQPGQSTIEMSPHLNRSQFGQHMDEARKRFPQIANEGHHIGVFHDADKGTVEIDPVLVVKRPRQVEQVGAATHAIGGAYHMESGNGYFPPHVDPKLSGRQTGKPKREM